MDNDDEDDEDVFRSNHKEDDTEKEEVEVVGVEVFREKTIEDLIEEQRERLIKEGRKGTPVTAESFAKWRGEKLLRKQAEAEARMKAEQAKKKGAKICKFMKFLFNYFYSCVIRKRVI